MKKTITIELDTNNSNKLDFRKDYITEFEKEDLFIASDIIYKIKETEEHGDKIVQNMEDIFKLLNIIIDDNISIKYNKLLKKKLTNRQKETIGKLIHYAYLLVYKDYPLHMICKVLKHNNPLH